jgi:preprotein translocase subunit SecD
MLQFNFSRIVLIAVVIVASLFFALPNMLPSSVLPGGKFPDWWRPVNLGLDLRGGSRLLLEVDTGSVFKEQLGALEETARGALRDAKIRTRNIRPAEDAVFVVLADAADLAAARREIAKSSPGVEIDNQGEDRLRITVPDKLRRERQNAAIDQSLEIVRRRIDPGGTSEASIQRQGTDRILVELPGVDDPERIKSLIGKTAKMTFQLVEPNATSTDPRDLPPGTMLVPDSRDPTRMYVLRRRIEVSGDRLVDAQPSFKEGGLPVISFRFDTAGGRSFAQTTSNNVGQRFAIVLDGKVLMDPVIKSPIVGGTGIIEGVGNVQEVKDLCLILRAGALPAQLNVLEERTVGPGLGADSIKAGGLAAMVGGVLVVVFMVLAYHTFGIFAVFGQLFHMITLFAVLSLVGGTLTLPGIAGVVLSLGMAVDANVLIYERMREEFRSGRTLLSSLTSGFQNAFATIVDANLTTLIAAGILYFLGAGPVRGFAVTLFVGIMTSLFSAVMVTRFQVWLWYRAGKRTELPV